MATPFGVLSTQFTSSVDGAVDSVPFWQGSTNQAFWISRNTLLNIASQPVGISDSQTLTNKTITAPTISGPTLSGTVIGTYTLGGTPTFPASVVTLTGIQTLTNKTLTAPAITGGTLDNTTVTVDAIAGHTASTTGTIYGMSVTVGVLGSSALANTVNTAALQSSSVTAAKIAASAITPAALFTGTGATWPMASWSPSWTNLSVGNGTLEAKYVQVGKQVFCRLRLVFGSTTTVTGDVSLTLPVTAIAAYGSNQHYVAPILLRAAGSNSPGIVNLTSTTSAEIVAVNAASTYLAQASLAAAVPATWANGDWITGEWWYEAA